MSTYNKLLKKSDANIRLDKKQRNNKIQRYLE